MVPSTLKIRVAAAAAFADIRKACNYWPIMQKLTAKEWVHQKINYYTIEDIIPTGPEETYCKELSSILRPGIPQTFGTLQKWEDFDAEVLKLYEGLDNTQRDYNKLVSWLC